MRLRLGTGVLGVERGDELILVYDVAVASWSGGGGLVRYEGDPTSIMCVLMLLLLLKVPQAQLTDLLRNYSAGPSVGR